MSPRTLAGLVLACVLALGALLLVAAGREDISNVPLSTRYECATIPKGVRAPDFRLRDENGKPFSMRALRGRPVIVSFLYTTCKETCPAQAQTIKGALAELGHDVPALAIAVDPPRDTPKRARAFLAEQRMTGRMRFALGSRRQLKRVWKGYAMLPQREDLEHTSRFVLVDRRGYQRIGFPIDQATPERLAHDLALLEREG